MKTNADLLIAQNLLYDPCGFQLTNFAQESESREYNACTFELGTQKVQFRTAKITPTKVGQFVTFWKRINGPILPYDLADSVDIFIVSVRNGEHFGQFIFPKEVLYEKGFISKNGHGGKRAMRVYPPWDIANNAQAKKTQSWQLLYFCEIQPVVDTAQCYRLLNNRIPAKK